MSKFYNVKGASVSGGQLTTELIKPSEEFDVKSVSLANIHGSDSASVDVFLANPTDNYYIIKNVVIPFATTLILEEDEVDYNTSVYNLYVKLSASDSAVDIIIRS